MPHALKIIFFLSTTSSTAFTVSSVVTIALCLTSYKKQALILGSISTFIYASLFLCIWANLTVRLYVAFQGSIYKLTQREQIGYILTFIYLVLNAFAASICQLLVLVGEDLAPPIWVQLLLGVLFMVIFSVSALCAMCAFTEKTFILGKSRTKKQIKVFCEEEPIPLNEMQEKLMDLSSKYISLFLLASLSSFITMFSGFYESASDLRVSLFLVPVDCCVNLVCIFLQYNFAVDHYNKFCGPLDRCCKRIMTNGWKASIHSTRREERQLELQEQAAAAKQSDFSTSPGLDIVPIPENATFPAQSHEQKSPGRVTATSWSSGGNENAAINVSKPRRSLGTEDKTASCMVHVHC